MSLLWELPSWLCAPRPGLPGPPPQALQCPGAQTRHEAGHPAVGSSGVWAQDPQERAPPRARAWTVLRALEQKAPVGQAWGDPEKGPETTRKVAETSQSLCRPLTLTLGAGGPADPAPSWPAQRLPLCGAPTLDPRGRARGGGWAEWHLQPHGVLGEFLRSSTARAQKTAASARMGGSRAPGRAGPGQAREGQAQCSGLHTARPGGRGPQGAHPPRGMDRQTGTRPVGVPPP